VLAQGQFQSAKIIMSLKPGVLVEKDKSPVREQIRLGVRVTTVTKDASDFFGNNDTETVSMFMDILAQTALWGAPKAILMATYQAYLQEFGLLPPEPEKKEEPSEVPSSGPVDEA